MPISVSCNLKSYMEFSFEHMHIHNFTYTAGIVHRPLLILMYDQSVYLLWIPTSVMQCMNNNVTVLSWSCSKAFDTMSTSRLTRGNLWRLRINWIGFIVSYKKKNCVDNLCLPLVFWPHHRLPFCEPCEKTMASQSADGTVYTSESIICGHHSQSHILYSIKYVCCSSISMLIHCIFNHLEPSE